jgi:hypothetical protein
MFLQQPHRTIRGYKDIAASVTKEVFVETDKLEPYYVAGFALYKLNAAFNTAKIPTAFKIARYQILLAARLILDNNALPKMNSNEMEKRCTFMMERLWKDADTILTNATDRLNQIVNGNLDRDYIHTQPVTDAILDAFGQKNLGI